jgi:Ni/Co efflux regulator RcnB
MKKLLFPAATLAIALSAPLALAADPDGNDQQHERTDRGANKPGDAMTKSDGGAAAGSNTIMRARPDGAVTGNGRGRNETTVNDNDRVRNNTTVNDNDRIRNKTIVNDNDRVRNDTVINRTNTTINRTVVRKRVDRNTVIKFRANVRAPHRFHFNRAYVHPAGWYAHRWTFGERLPRAFFAPDYFILDFATFGLMTPWSGYEWVRYGNDALLIDVETGEVIRVEYDLFY